MVSIYVHDLQKFNVTTRKAWNADRASGSGPAAPILAKPVFLKVKIKVYFYKQQVMNKRSSVMYRLVRLITLNYS